MRGNGRAVVSMRQIKMPARIRGWQTEGCNGAVIPLDANPAPMVKRPLTGIAYRLG